MPEKALLLAKKFLEVYTMLIVSASSTTFLHVAIGCMLLSCRFCTVFQCALQCSCIIHTQFA